MFSEVKWFTPSEQIGNPGLSADMQSYKGEDAKETAGGGTEVERSVHKDTLRRKMCPYLV